MNTNQIKIDVTVEELDILINCLSSLEAYVNLLEQRVEQLETELSEKNSEDDHLEGEL